ncbi:hypothetical protein PG994_006122 [Apiospora phragmitis]|uniref:Uncharacterized protein n=1 Tax=Apiospora phragmitis TaxID=2905665 RepID=A0ABR1VE57_9PEZI
MLFWSPCPRAGIAAKPVPDPAATCETCCGNGLSGTTSGAGSGTCNSGACLSSGGEYGKVTNTAHVGVGDGGVNPFGKAAVGAAPAAVTSGHRVCMVVLRQTESSPVQTGVPRAEKVRGQGAVVTQRSWVTQADQPSGVSDERVGRSVRLEEDWVGVPVGPEVGRAVEMFDNW